MEFDLELVHHVQLVLQHTFSSDPALVKLAEVELAKIRATPGMLMLLLRVTVQQGVAREVKQAGGLAVKNLIKERWDHRVPDNIGPTAVLTESDRMQIRHDIIEAMVLEGDKSLTDILCECVKEIALVDFPARWPDLIASLVRNIQTGQVIKVHNSLLALRRVVKVYEYKPADKRGPLDTVILQVFPLLRNICHALMPNQDESCSKILKLVLKIFWSCTQFQFPPQECYAAADLPGWMDIIGHILQRPNDGQPADVHIRAQWPGWKLKKWGCEILSRFFTRYGNPNFATKESLAFAQQFSSVLAPRLLSQIMQLLALRPQGQYCSDKVVHSCMVFVNSAIEISGTYKLLKPHLDFLLFQVAFPTMLLKQDDISLFTDDPKEYVRRNYDCMEDFLDPKAPAITLLIDLSRYRKKDVLPRLLNFIGATLNKYTETPPDRRDYREKDGVMVVIGSLREILKHKKYAYLLEPLIAQHLIPEFTSHLGFMRSRACWLAQRLASMKHLGRDNLLECLKLTLRALQDKDLPVKIEAASALQYLIGVDGAANIILPLLPEILNQYFIIMAEIGNDLVVQALETLIDKFADNIGPHAVILAQKLCECFLGYAAEGYEDDDAALAAGQCIEAISTVLQSARNTPRLYASMEVHIIPMLTAVLVSDGEYMEYLENTLESVSILLTYSPEISPGLWSLFPMLFEAYENSMDYVTNLAVPIFYFITRGTTQFLQGATQQGVSYVDLVISLADKVLSDEHMTENDCYVVVKLLMSVLQKCQTLNNRAIDQRVPSIMKMTIKKLAGTISSTLKVALIENIASIFAYNPEMTFALLESEGGTAHVLNQMVDLLESDSKSFSKTTERCIALGLCSFLRVPPASLPTLVQNHMPKIISTLIGLLYKLNDASENAEVDEEADEVGSDSDKEGAGDGQSQGANGVEPDGEEEDFEEDQDVTNSADVAYMSSLSKHGEYDDALLDWGDEDDEDEDFPSVLEHVDELEVFYTAFQRAFAAAPAAYNQLQAQLSPEVMNQCKTLIQKAEEKARAPR